MSDLGQAQVIVYMTHVNETQIEDLMEVIADWAVDNDLAGGLEDDVKVLVGSKALPFPNLEGEAAEEFLSEHTMFMIPNDGN